jgi:hypothetical protein
MNTTKTLSPRWVGEPFCCKIVSAAIAAGKWTRCTGEDANLFAYAEKKEPDKHQDASSYERVPRQVERPEAPVVCAVAISKVDSTYRTDQTSEIFRQLDVRLQGFPSCSWMVAFE